MKIVVISRKYALRLLMILAGGLLLLFLLGFGVRGAVSVASSARKVPIYCVDTTEKKIAISFDAAWGNEDTQQLIDILQKYNVKTTFFVVGQWVDKYPESVKALADAGHEIMNHSDTHPHMSQLSADGIRKEVNACNDKIAAITGIRPTLLRPPYGDYNNTLVSTLKDMGIYCIQWDVDSLDWKGLSPQQICDRVVKGVKNGSIVLFHNAAEHTPEALPLILDELILKQGYTIVPVSQLIHPGVYEGDHEGKQHAG
jgi:polysaccharide deacetylase family sporulation protein PdaB